MTDHVSTTTRPNLTRLMWSALILAAAAGAAVTGYLTYTSVSGTQVLCLGGGGGCEEVQSSRFAFIAGVPVAALGLGFYVSVLALAMAAVVGGSPWRPRALPVLLALTGAGALFSLYLVGVQALAIHAFCGWCLVSAALSLILLVLATALVLRAE